MHQVAVSLFVAHTRFIGRVKGWADYISTQAIRPKWAQRLEFIKENKKVRKQEKKSSTKKAIKKKRKQGRKQELEASDQEKKKVFFSWSFS